MFIGDAGHVLRRAPTLSAENHPLGGVSLLTYGIGVHTGLAAVVPTSVRKADFKRSYGMGELLG